MAMNSRLIERARELLRTGHSADARAVLDRILAAEPENEEVWQLRLAASETTADREQALKALLRLRPEDDQIWQQIVALNTPETIVRERSHHYRGLYFAAAALVIIAAIVALYFASHNPLQKDVDRLTAYNLGLTAAYTQLDRAHESLAVQYKTLQGAHARLQADFAALQDQYAQLQQQHNQLAASYQALQQQHSQLQNDYQVLRQSYTDLQAYSDQLYASFAEFRDTAIAPPYIYIHERKIEMVFQRTSGSTDRWSIDFEGLEEAVEEGSALRNPTNNNVDHFSLPGYAGQHMNFQPFVDPAPFKDIMSQLYYEVGQDEQAFLHETWYIMGQLTGYVTDDTLRETPRFPLETLLSGGGDCEDTSILFASLIKAAPVNWQVYLFYMDGENPANTQAVNHVIVLVETPTAKHYIETTSHSTMEPYIVTGIQGWKLLIP